MSRLCPNGCWVDHLWTLKTGRCIASRPADKEKDTLNKKRPPSACYKCIEHKRNYSKDLERAQSNKQ